MRFLYPQDPLNEKLADGPYQDEYQALLGLGVDCARFDFDAIAFDEFAPFPRIQSGEAILYKGWMLTPEGYQTLTKYIQNCDGIPITTIDDYSQCHHLKNWYTACQDLTAETHFFDVSDDIVEAAQQLGWDSFFVKDFVKSNTGDKGSIQKIRRYLCNSLSVIKITHLGRCGLGSYWPPSTLTLRKFKNP